MLTPLLIGMLSWIQGANERTGTIQSDPPRAFAARSFAASAGAARELRILVVPLSFQGKDSSFSSERLARTFLAEETTLSVRRFYREQSGGALDIVARVLPWSLSAIPRDSLGGDMPSADSCGKMLMLEAANHALAQGVDLSLYDNDGNGEVDGLIVVFSGQGYQETGKPGDPRNSLFSTSTNIALSGGLKIRQYIRLAETDKGLPLNPGCAAHEIGHLLGLPDLYDANLQVLGFDGGLGAWDLMSNGDRGMGWNYSSLATSGGWKPTGLSAFCRATLGWLAPREIESQQEVRLAPGEAARLWIDPYRSNEYLMLENRDRSTGDSVLPGPGLLAMRVRSDKVIMASSNTAQDVNSDSSAMGVEIIEASGRQRIASRSSIRPESQDLYGVASDSLTDAGPVALSKDGAPSGAWLREIRVDGNDVVFRANPAPKRGYGILSEDGPLFIFNDQQPQITLMMGLKIPVAGRIVGMNSVLFRSASKVCVGIWQTRPGMVSGVAPVSACDSGGFPVWLKRFSHRLETPISVAAGQTIWVGQTAFGPGTNSGMLAGAPIDAKVDTVWYYAPNKAAARYGIRPSVGVLVETDSVTTAVPTDLVASGFRLRPSGRIVRLEGARAGETVHLALRDLRGRRLWNMDAICDATGAAKVEITRDGAGLRILEAEGSFGTRTLALPQP